METCKANQCIKNNSLFHEGQLSPWNDFEKCSKPIFKEGFCKRCFSKDHRFKNNNWIKDQLWKRDGIYGEPYDFPYHTKKSDKVWVEKIYTLHPDIRPQKDDYEDDYEQRQRAVREWLDKYSTKIDYKMGKELEKIISKS